MARKQLNIKEKLTIINYYNSIKGVRGAKAKTIEKFKLSGYLYFKLINLNIKVNQH